jgi:esterase/lipase
LENLSNKIVHTDSFKVPRYLLTLGKALQFVSTGAATNFVAKLFSTPVRFKAPERELVMRESAKKERLQLDSTGKEIQVYVYGYSKTKVLLVHGWAGRGTQLYQIADKVLENRMMIISFDAPAHGLSSGKMTNMLEYIEAIRAVDKKYGPFHAAIGHSFGGMSLINAIASGMKVNYLVTIGADNSIPDIFRYFVEKMQLKPAVAQSLERLFEKKHRIGIDSLSSARKAKRVKTQTLVIHDSGDRYVHLSSAVDIRHQLDKGELLVTSGLGHHRIFRDPVVIRRIIEFIT